MGRLGKCWILFLVCVMAGSISGQIMAMEMQQEEIIQQEQVEETEVVQQEQTETEEVMAQELDLGDYQSRMAVGERQLLMVTVIPMETKDQKLAYSSANETVATVNGMGRITANAVGETEIKVTCGNIEESFLLMVVEADDAEETVEVADIELADYDETLEVGKTLCLQATVLPTDAAGSITYVSSDTSVATVNSNGEVKGIAKGTVTIFCKAGAVTKEIPLNIIVATDKLSVNQEYLVLQPGEGFSLKSSVSPYEADQHVSYRSVDEGIATVSKSGQVYAVACGSTCIMVSNEDAVTSVSVIVDWKYTQSSEESSVSKGNAEKKIDVLTRVSVESMPLLSEKILKQLYLQKKTLTIYGDEYEYQIDGNQIVNYNNPFRTDLEFIQEENGVSFVVNSGEELCGTVILALKDVKGNYLYLYNPSKEKYQLITDYVGEKIELTTGGKYLVTQKKLRVFHWNPLLFSTAIGLLLMIAVIFVVVKKRYWFW